MERIIRQQEIALAGRCITVRELSVADVRHLVTQTDGDSGLFGELLTLLDRSTGLKPDDLNPFTFSELEKLFDTIIEVNRSFFALARKMGLTGLGEKIRRILIDSFTVSFSGSLSEDMPGSGNMDGPSSSMPSKPVTRPTSNGPD